MFRRATSSVATAVLLVLAPLAVEAEKPVIVKVTLSTEPDRLGWKSKDVTVSASQDPSLWVSIRVVSSPPGGHLYVAFYEPARYLYQVGDVNVSMALRRTADIRYRLQVAGEPLTRLHGTWTVVVSTSPIPSGPFNAPKDGDSRVASFKVVP
ncbi:MAG TPA: hypothetical protein VL084_02555 [Thermoanaerobaculia bacterium]|nr:hypothetical protein [Thermoanaerobaculia bacterium]